MATPHGLWESTFLKRKSHLDLPRNAPISIFSKQVHPEWTHDTISSNMFPPIVMFGFRRNPDVAGNGRSGGWECVWLIAIDYHTVAGTARVECKGD